MGKAQGSVRNFGKVQIAYLVESRQWLPETQTYVIYFVSQETPVHSLPM